MDRRKAIQTATDIINTRFNLNGVEKTDELTAALREAVGDLQALISKIYDDNEEQPHGEDAKPL